MLYLSIAALGLNFGAMRAPASARATVSMDLDKPIRVAVVGGGPSGACAAEIFAKVWADACVQRIQPSPHAPGSLCWVARPTQAL